MSVIEEVLELFDTIVDTIAFLLASPSIQLRALQRFAEVTDHAYLAIRHHEHVSADAVVGRVRLDYRSCGVFLKIEFLAVRYSLLTLFERMYPLWSPLKFSRWTHVCLVRWTHVT